MIRDRRGAPAEVDDGGQQRIEGGKYDGAVFMRVCNVRTLPALIKLTKYVITIGGLVLRGANSQRLVTL